MNLRKIFLYSVLLFIFIPVLVSAKNICTIIKGNGKDIGSEVKCGTEEFYVIENKNNKVKLLAKYNLNVGDKINYFEVVTNDEFGERYTGSTYEIAFNNAKMACMNKAQEKGYHPYYVYPMTRYLFTVKSANNTEPASTGDIYNEELLLTGCRVYEAINEDRVRQDSRALGTKLNDEGKSVLPLYGIVYMNPQWGYDAIVNGVIATNDYDSNGNLIVRGSSFETYLNNYKSELERQGYTIDSVSFITLNNTLELLHNISGQEVEVNLTPPNYSPNMDYEDLITSKMNIKPYIAAKYNWIYNITYWLGSGFKYGDGTSEFNDYYISNQGMLYALGRGEYAYLEFPIGNGLRPLVTVSTEDIGYDIKTKVEGAGEIEVTPYANGGDTISFSLKASIGLKLDKLIITTDSNEVIEFSEEDIIQDETGNYSIRTSKFTMPYENVTIEARLVSVTDMSGGINAPDEGEKANNVDVPNTLSDGYRKLTILIVVALVLIAIGLYIYGGNLKKEKNEQ